VALARSRHGALEYAHERHRHERRRDIRPIVDIFRQREATDTAAAADEADRVDRQQQRHSAPIFRRFCVEDMRIAEPSRERLHTIRMLVQQEP
jgi:hypothetical protein